MSNRNKIRLEVILVIAALTLMAMIVIPDPTQTTQDQHNFQVGEQLLKEMEAHWNEVDIDKESIDWTGTTQGIDTIPSYNRFADVPAGIGDTIMVDGIVYKINNDKTKWVPLNRNPEEITIWN